MNIYKVYVNDNYIDNEFELIVCYAKNEKNADVRTHLIKLKQYKHKPVA